MKKLRELLKKERIEVSEIKNEFSGHVDTIDTKFCSGLFSSRNVRRERKLYNFTMGG